MALWDALSGKIYRWNKMKDEAFLRACKSIKPFVSSRLAQYPNAREFFIDARNNLFAYFRSAYVYIPQMLDDDFATFKDSFYSFSVESYLRFICAFHASHVTMAYSAQEKESLLYLMSDGLIEMYGYPVDRMRAWWPYVQQL